MLNGFNKQKLSFFTGGATRFDKAEDRRLMTSIDVYESDFGTMQVTPNRWIRKSYIQHPLKEDKMFTCLKWIFGQLRS